MDNELQSNPLLIMRVEIPEQYAEIAEPVEEEPIGRCAICRSGQRESIEAIALSGRSMNSAAEYITKHLGLKTTGTKLRYHMTNHVLEERAQRFIQLYTSASNFNQGYPTVGDDIQLTTVQGLIMVMLNDALRKVLTGTIEVKDMADVEKVVKMYQQGMKLAHDQRMSERKMEIEEKRLTSEEGGASNVADALRQLGYIMVALREEVPTDILEQVVLRAWSLGMNKEIVDLAEVPLYKTDYEELDMGLAVQDQKALGRARTREELAEAEWSKVEKGDPDIPPE